LGKSIRRRHPSLRGPAKCRSLRMREVASSPISSHACAAGLQFRNRPTQSVGNKRRRKLRRQQQSNRACNSNPTRPTGPLPRSSGLCATSQWQVPARTLRVVPGLGGSRCCCVSEARPVPSAPRGNPPGAAPFGALFRGRVVFVPVFARCNGYDFRAGRTAQEGSRFAHRPHGGPRATVISGSLPFARTQFPDWSGLWRRLHGLSLCCALANKPGPVLIANSTRRSPPLSLIRGKPVGRKVPPAISAGQPSAPRPSVQ
jgi:hypothetical protein